MLWDAQLVLRILVEEPPPESESLRDVPFYRLAGQVDRIHRALLFRKEQLGKKSETIPIPEAEEEELGSRNRPYESWRVKANQCNLKY